MSQDNKQIATEQELAAFSKEMAGYQEVGEALLKRGFRTSSMAGGDLMTPLEISACQHTGLLHAFVKGQREVQTMLIPTIQSLGALVMQGIAAQRERKAQGWILFGIFLLLLVDLWRFW